MSKGYSFLSLTGCRFLLADPTNEEEELMTGTLTVIYSSNGTLSSIIKTGSPLKEEYLKECIQRAKERVSEVVALIKNEKENK
jgi:exosome complex RNA-binding protein Rrp42 (RNase PH superfamily)